jgi:hypothetical protein
MWQLFRPYHGNQKYCRECRRKRTPTLGCPYTSTTRARGSHCKLAEWVDGELVGGFIRGPWDLGHADLESSGGPEHRECNRATAGRPRVALGGSSRIW